MIFPWDEHILVCECGCPRSKIDKHACESCNKTTTDGDTVLSLDLDSYENRFLSPKITSKMTNEDYDTWDWKIWEVD